MRKLFSIILCFLIFGSVFMVLLPQQKAQAQTTSPNLQGIQPTILILINENIYSQIRLKLSVFEQDLHNEGFEVVNATVSAVTSPLEIRDILRSYYSEKNLVGAILIGNIRAAYTEIHTGDYSNPEALKIMISLDACDMYYMDLDGQWEYVPNPQIPGEIPPNVVECNLYESCETFKNEYIVYPDYQNRWDYSTIENKEQYEAEIWVSRIMVHNLDIPGYSEAQLINNFLDWDHAYRVGLRQVSDKCYLLEAGPVYDDQGVFQDMEYSRIFDTNVMMVNVTKDDYISCLEDPAGSELVYLGAHSGPQGHALYDQFLITDDLINTNRTCVFYVLNACSSCRWDNYISFPDNPNYLGGLYVFDKTEENRDYGLGAIGFTGVGGFNFLNFFTEYLNTNPNPTYGEAYKYWFNENLMRIFGPANYVYLGDPTIGPKDVTPLMWANLEWDILHGSWTVDNGELNQIFTGEVSWAFAGDTSWRDYDLEVDVKFLEGAPEASIGFRSPDENNIYYFCLAGGAKVLTIAKIIGGVETYNVQSTAWSNPQYDKWYHVEIEVRGDRIKTYLDGSLIFDYVASDLPNSGRIGLRMFYTRANFNNLIIRLYQVHTVVIDGTDFYVTTESNSTISDFMFIQAEKEICFNVTGLSGTYGFCNITIPKQLLEGPFVVMLNGHLISEVLATENSTHTSIYFTYPHSEHKVEIVGATVIPEFPVLILLPLFVAVTLIAFLIRRKLRIS